VLARGESQRVKVPEERWGKIYNHHPDYLTLEEQEEIKSILKKNHFERRDRPGRGPALLQGLLRCAKCNASLRVQYVKGRSCTYDCAWFVEGCTRFNSSEFDGRILAEAFKVFKTPPLEMLKAALEEAQSQEQKQLEWIESERERLEHEKRKAEELVDQSYGKHRRVYDYAVEKLDAILKEKDQFDQKVAIKLSAPKIYESKQELEEHCRRASDVPSLWHYPLVTFQERKQLLRLSSITCWWPSPRKDLMRSFSGHLAPKPRFLYSAMPGGII